MKEQIKEVAKHGHKSKTIWFATIGVPALMAGLEYAQANIAMVKENLGASYLVTSFIISLSVTMLRIATKSSLKDKP